MGMRGPTLKTLERIVDTFNQNYPVGSRVVLKTDSGPVETVIRAPAEILGGHAAVGWFENNAIDGRVTPVVDCLVLAENVRGCYAIDGRVTPVVDCLVLAEPAAEVVQDA